MFFERAFKVRSTSSFFLHFNRASPNHNDNDKKNNDKIADAEQWLIGVREKVPKRIYTKVDSKDY